MYTFHFRYVQPTGHSPFVQFFFQQFSLLQSGISIPTFLTSVSSQTTNSARYGQLLHHLSPFHSPLAQTRQMNSLVITTRPSTRGITSSLQIQIIISTPTHLVRCTSQKVQLSPISTPTLRNDRITLQAPSCCACRAVEKQGQIGGGRGADVEIHGSVG